MAELTTLARPYARAAFEIAAEQQQLAAWAETLGTLAGVVKTAKVQEALDAPGLTALAKSHILEALLGDGLSPQHSNFLRTLADNKRLALLPYIYELFLALKAEHEKTLNVEVVSAFALDLSWQETLAKALGKKLDRRINISTQLDKSLLGGAIIRAGDTVIDGSVKGRLAKLAEAMNS
jgi:F-type H+-transporting ATPase subunit delta